MVLKKTKRKSFLAFAFTLMMLTSIVASGAAFAKSAGYYTTSNSRTAKSIVGIPVYTIGVSGQYYTNGKSVSKQTNATCLNSTHYPGWSVQSQKASWTLKTASKSIVTNTSTFFYGLDTQWVKIGIQSYTEQITANATP